MAKCHWTMGLRFVTECAEVLGCWPSVKSHWAMVAPQYGMGIERCLYRAMLVVYLSNTIKWLLVIGYWLALT